MCVWLAGWGSKANRKLHASGPKLEGLGLMSWVSSEAAYSRNVNPSNVFQLEKKRQGHRLNSSTQKEERQGQKGTKA